MQSPFILPQVGDLIVFCVHGYDYNTIGLVIAVIKYGDRLHYYKYIRSRNGCVEAFQIEEACNVPFLQIISRCVQE